ncbi:MAG: 50S ribosomal protein L25 [Desulfococcaceae bacterium]|nr:50S ribosomal protein L25 [Desulfococcaceae bacterium]
MERFELHADIRTAKGNSPARALRREGKIPAVLYGPGINPAMLSVNKKDMENVVKERKAGRQLFDLRVGEARDRQIVMLKELQAHPVSRKYIHADFYQVPMDQKIRIRVPVRTTGKAVGVEMGGMLQIIRHTLEVICYPKDIPEAVVLDVSELNMGESIHIKEIKMENLEFPAEVNFTVLTLLGAKGKEDEEEAEGEEETEESETGETEE